MSPREFLIGVCFNITLEFPNHCCGTPLSKDNALWDAFPKALSKHTTCAKTHHTHTYTEVGACWNTAIHLLSHHLKLKVSNHIKKKGGGVAMSYLTLCDLMDYTQSMAFSRPDTGVGSHLLLQRIFPTQGVNPGLPPYRRILYHLSPQGNSHILNI